ARPKVGLGMPDLRRDAAADRDDAGWTREGAFMGQSHSKGRAAAGPCLVIGFDRCAAPVFNPPSSLPDLDCTMKTSLDNFQSRLGKTSLRFRHRHDAHAQGVLVVDHHISLERPFERGARPIDWA
ncbi:MAG: hypothetical protein AAGC99_04660, partial [Pseudomonadota bacterium]